MDGFGVPPGAPHSQALHDRIKHAHAPHVGILNVETVSPQPARKKENSEQHTPEEVTEEMSMLK